MTADPKTILVVDDEEPVRRVLCTLLETEGFSVLEASSGRDCLRLTYAHRPDLVLLDIMLDDRDGREVCRQLRDISADLPIIMLTALSSEQEKVGRFNDGADDFLTKPFHKDELVARIRAILRRVERIKSPRTRAYHDSCMSVDFEARQLDINGVSVELSPKLWRLLEYFVEHKDRVVSQRELLHYAWGAGYETETRYLKVHISLLRHKLGDDRKSPRYIRTARAQGYVFQSQA